MLVCGPKQYYHYHTTTIQRAINPYVQPHGAPLSKNRQDYQPQVHHQRGTSGIDSITLWD